MEAVAMFSADGEKVDFNTQVTLEGPVEVTINITFYNIFSLHSNISRGLSLEMFISL